MSQPSKVKSGLTLCSSAPTTTKSSNFKAVLEALSKVLQKFIKETPSQDAPARSENKSKKGLTEDPNEKSYAMDPSSNRKNHNSKRKAEKGDTVKILTPYRPKDGYFHDPEISSQKGSMLSLPSDHSDRSYALSIFSLVSSTKTDTQEGVESVLPNARKSKRGRKKTDSE